MAKGKYQEWLEPDGLLRIEAWAREGLTDANIAEKIGINVTTLYAWQRDYPQISKALKKGKAPVDTEVENLLLKRARGYNYDETTEEWRPNQETGELELVSKKVQRKHMPPDTTAQIFWLKNRRPDLWRDKPEAKKMDDTTITVKFAQADMAE